MLGEIEAQGYQVEESCYKVTESNFLFFSSFLSLFFYIKTHFFEFADKGNVSFLPVPCLGFYLHSLFGQLWQ